MTTETGQYAHDERFEASSGSFYLSAWDALVRLPIMRRRIDERNGLSTSGYVSGYPGSPLGGLDSLFRRRAKNLSENGVHFEPGVNEDLAATQVGGTQWLNTGSFDTRFDGVFGLWYGKGPGVERSADAIRTSSYQGTSRTGGVLAIAGDDHEARSTVTAQQSDTLFIHMHMPILTPASVQEVIDFGIAGWDMSRYASTWVGMPCVNDIAETAMVVDVDLGRLDFVRPSGIELPPTTGTSRYGGRGAFGAADIEQEIVDLRLPAAQRFVRENGLDRVVFAPVTGARRRVGIVTAGKTYLDVLGALAELDLDEDAAAELGIGLYKLAMTWPVEPEGLLEFAADFDELLVIEAKYPIIEDQINRIIHLVDRSARPTVTGKLDEKGGRQLPQHGTLESAMVARILAQRLRITAGDAGEITVPQPRESLQLNLLNDSGTVTSGPALVRKAGFCSGCPHNLSTRVPDGAIAVSGTGCHNMALTVDAPGRPTELIAQMGGEGGLWIGMAPFATRKHSFQNMGDGTFHHSGHLAVRAAVAANTPMTFKILLNGYIAMTGGQSTPSPQSAIGIAKQVLSEGVQRVAIVTDDIARFPRRARWRLPQGTTLHDRTELDSVQRELSDIVGPTVLIYDQPCAAEVRRHRKSGRAPQPDKRVFINDSVCEGCGDCNVQSNCISVEPLDTDQGRKRYINQSSCNFDYSCLTGNCPSFVTVYGATPRKLASKIDEEFLPSAVSKLPAPVVSDIGNSFNILVGGIGGSGVLTVGAVIGMAAHLEGRGVSVLNESGLAQKNGAVESHVKVTPSPLTQAAPRIGTSQSDVIIGADSVVAASRGSMASMRAGRTWACLNSTVNPTVAFAGYPEMAFDSDPLITKIRRATGDSVAVIDSSGLATKIMGDAIYGNLVLLGYAAQSGHLPVKLESIYRAIEINGVAVADNKTAFDWGRLAAQDLELVLRQLDPHPKQTVDDSVHALRQRRFDELVDYQNIDYAQRFDVAVEAVRLKVSEIGVADERLEKAVTESLFKLMAYKDEYEVARLYTQPSFLSNLSSEFEGDYKVKINLAPQVLNRRDKAGRAKKIEIPAEVVMPLFRMLAPMKRFRGTAFDLPGMTKHRRAERARIESFIDLVGSVVVPGLKPENYDTAVELAALPQLVRGYDDVKDRNATAADNKQRELVKQFRSLQPAASTAFG